MTKGEKAFLICAPDYAYGAAGSPPKIPPSATLRFEVELISFAPKPREIYDMSAAERLSAAEAFKATGNAAWAKGDSAGALREWMEAARHLEDTMTGSDEAERAAASPLWLSVQGNAAAANLKLHQWVDAARCATEVLKLQPENAKALFRRGTARSHIGDVSEARSDLLAAVRAAPADTAVRSEYERVVKLVAAQREKERAAFGGIFTRKNVSLYDEKPGVAAPPVPAGPLPRAFFDVSIGGVRRGRVIFELYSHAAPRTAANFLALCRGNAGVTKSGVALAFKGSAFHRIIPNFMAQGGDFTRGDGTGGESIYGEKFADEPFVYKHDAPHLLSMANAGPNTNGSQFFITFTATPHLNGKHVVFGRVVDGADVVRAMEAVKTLSGDRPAEGHEVVIDDCGVIDDDGKADLTEVVSAPAESDAEMKA